ncbi:tetrapyrrole biosynthesis, uroporphyrinogen III synthase [Radiomyces spectabilis]|uniref:tetrapyrrole biosynthesis, uroporphyrinogen III synthase n=1 Tax=Radiomyces spectabilis TaxID=64574 RepID=UPI002220A271|nr:tetrapyrrole biosynthesis, uroporphyrinogen III synthase [Radiomyces spectabilis]KAI8394322.1 tetrapyrrole biosynthesis, uroporphyrinogen III synthase [Radiomyces spectabilis]
MAADRVWVFKVQSEEGQDEYDTQLRRHGYHPIFIPVLAHKTESHSQLRDIVIHGPRYHHIAGLIITSQRSVETLTEVLHNLSLDSATASEWHTLPVYVVGHKTAEKLQQLPLFQGLHSNWIIADRAAELHPAIIAQVKSTIGDRQLLFLAGDKRRDELPNHLAKANIAVKEIRCYSTCAHPELAQKLGEIKVMPDDWTVYFSPSGIRYIQETTHPFTAKIAAIGPTTADYLGKLGMNINVVSRKPDAAHLVADMVTYDRSLS